MSLVAILAVLKRVPARLYLIALIVAALAVGGYAMYRKGERHERQQAVAVETRKSVAAVKVATEHANTVIAVAQKADTVSHAAVERSDARRADRAAVKQAALGELLATDIPKIQQLVAVDDAVIAGDSLTIAKLVETNALKSAAIDSLLRERDTRQHLDSVRVEAIDVGQPRSHTGRNLTLAAVGGAALTLIIAAVTR